MHRCTLRSLVALLAVVLLGTGLIAPRGALAAPSSVRRLPAPSKDFKGKVVAKNPDTNLGPNYFVLSFTCSGGTLTTADWTYEVSSTQSFTGTSTGMPAAPAPACALVSATNGSGVSYSTTKIPLFFNGMPVTTGTGTPSPQAMLSLCFTNIMGSKTYFGKFFPSTSPKIAEDCTTTTIPEDCTTSGASTCVGVKTDDPLTIPTVPNPVAGFSLGGNSFSTLNLSAQ